MEIQYAGTIPGVWGPRACPGLEAESMCTNHVYNYSCCGALPNAEVGLKSMAAGLACSGAVWSLGPLGLTCHWGGYTSLETEVVESLVFHWAGAMGDCPPLSFTGMGPVSGSETKSGAHFPLVL